MLDNKPTTLLDRRVPQPNDYASDGLPDYIQAAASILYEHRKACTDENVPLIDGAILRLLAPWIRS